MKTNTCVQHPAHHVKPHIFTNEALLTLCYKQLAVTRGTVVSGEGMLGILDQAAYNGMQTGCPEGQLICGAHVRT